MYSHLSVEVQAIEGVNANVNFNFRHVGVFSLSRCEHLRDVDAPSQRLRPVKTVRNNISLMKNNKQTEWKFCQSCWKQKSLLPKHLDALFS